MNYDKMTLQQRYKARAEDTAIEWQADFPNHNYSYGELLYFQEHFTRLAKRYGLTKVFRENGII